MVVAKVWQLRRRPEGEPKESDFVCVEEELPPCKDGEIVVAAECLSVDPYMRYRVAQIPLNSTMVGEQVARVVESRNSRWPVGSLLQVMAGWRSHTHLSADCLLNPDNNVDKLPDMGDLPTSLALGVLGMPGNTAYLSLLEVMKPKVGETVVVSGAAGAVGSLVVQLAKLSGCKVVGFAGSKEKVAWLKELGADHAFNYKEEDVGAALALAAPDKVDIYFDNVGGSFSGQVMPHMGQRGRVLVCGAISTYNNPGDLFSNTMDSPFSSSLIIWKQLTIQGFVAYEWKHRWQHSFRRLHQWVSEGKLKYKESVVRGFENMPRAFIGLFRGTNNGKAVVLP